MDERRVGWHGLRRVCRRRQNRDVHREVKPTQTRTLAGESRETGGGRAGLRGEVRREVKDFNGTRPEGQLLDFRPPGRDRGEVRIAKVGRDGCVEYEAMEVDEARKRGERGEREMELGREGGVVEGLAETGEDFEGQICQGGMCPFGEDGKRRCPRIDGTRLKVGLQVQRAQFACWKVREKRLGGSWRRADSEGLKGSEECGIRTGRYQCLGQVGYVYTI